MKLSRSTFGAWGDSLLRPFECDDPRDLWRRYAFAVGVVLALLLGLFVLKERALTGADADAEKINMAGRQRMLSQRILYLAQISPQEEGAFDPRLPAVIDRFEHEFTQLKTAVVLPPVVESLYFGSHSDGNIDLLVTRFIALARSLVLDAAQDDVRAKMRKIGEETLLRKLDAAVAGYESAARARADMLNTIELLSLLAVTAVILLEVVFIFQPGNRLVIATLDRLTQKNKALSRLSYDLARQNSELEAHRQENEQQVAKLIEAVEESDVLRREHSRFTYSVSHDLKSPLNTLEMLLREISDDHWEVLSDEGREFLDLSCSTVDRMKALIESIQKYSNMVKGFECLREVDLDSLLSSVLDEKSEEIVTTGAVIRTSGLETILGCPVQLKLLLESLLDNALKFRAADRSPEIFISRGTDAGGMATITFSDNGIGIAAEDRDRIFSLFARLHTRDDFSGAGVGLAICQRVAANHNGSITVGESPAGGAQFVVTLRADLEEEQEEWNKLSA